MEAGVVVGTGSRSSFRKPSHAPSQRNYRRRSPSSSRSSSSPSPQPALSGGWKRDRSTSPSSPKRDGATNSSLHAKKGKTSHGGKYDSDEDSQGRRGEPGPGSSDRQARGASYDRYGRTDFRESRRSSAVHYDRHYRGSNRHTNRDYYGESRRNGDYESSRRGRETPDRGHRDDFRSRDRERRRSRDRDRAIDGSSARSRAGGRDIYREDNMEQDRSSGRDRDRYRDRDRNRERSRGVPASRELYHENDDDAAERRYEGGRSRDRDRERERERSKRRSTVREPSVGDDVEPGEIDRGRSRERNRERDRERGRESDKQSKAGAKDYKERNEWRGDKGRESEREKSKDRTGARGPNSDKDIEMDGDNWEWARDVSKDRHLRDRTEYKGGRDFGSVYSDREKDVDRSRDKSRVRGAESSRDQDDSRGQDRRRDHDRQGHGGDKNKARDFKHKEQSNVDLILGDEDEQRERSTSRDKDDHRRVEDLFKGKDDLGSLQEHRKSSHFHDDERSENRGSGGSDKALHQDKDRGKSSGLGKGSVHDQDMSDAGRDKEKSLVTSEMETCTKVTDEQGKLVPREGESSRDKNGAKRDSDRTAQQAVSVPAIVSDSDTKVSAGSDGKATKGSKWGPEATDSNTKTSASEELTSDLNAAKLAAMKAAELVNKNLGVAGFMSADQKKRLLWGSKKLAAEQEPAVTAGINRWDTVHFSDPDRQEKFHKLMGVKADASTESKKEGEADAGLFTEERQRELQQDLEKQFAAGLRRRDGGKGGLGL